VLVHNLHPGNAQTTMGFDWADSSKFVFEEAPLSDPSSPFVASGLYLAVLFVLHSVLNVGRFAWLNKAAKQIFIVHNWLLSAASAFMLQGLMRAGERSHRACVCAVWSTPVYVYVYLCVCLCTCSHAAISMLHCVHAVWVRFQQEGSAEFVLCESEAQAPTSGPLYYWVYLYYLSKFWELCDTVILVCKGSPPSFLQVGGVV
jgi:hypothetical protein